MSDAGIPIEDRLDEALERMAQAEAIANMALAQLTELQANNQQDEGTDADAFTLQQWLPGGGDGGELPEGFDNGDLLVWEVDDITEIGEWKVFSPGETPALLYWDGSELELIQAGSKHHVLSVTGDQGQMGFDVVRFP